MKTLEYFLDPQLRQIYLPALLVGLALVLMSGLLSVLVVVKRLGFIGQGISHSAFGGIGLASMLAAAGWIEPAGTGEFVVVVIFCVAASLGMASVSDRRRLPEDTAIGLFLVASMAAGAVLRQVARELAPHFNHAPDVRSWDSILFGSIAVVRQSDVYLSWGIAAAAALTLFALRRPMLFWVFDEESARAFGVPSKRMKATLMVLLAVAVVTAMKLAGVILATALLVLPGATALRLSTRLSPAIALSCAMGVAGLLGGLILSFEQNWPPGPCIVLIMTAIFALALLWSRLKPATN